MNLLDYAEEQAENTPAVDNVTDDLTAYTEEKLQNEGICLLEDYEEPDPEDIIKEFVL